ncbi:copper amine oxidase N-terminal domain-containing protein [Anaerosphaera multitolerans]|uniref:Copper amine oxidase N-terminal domain-containing protein n=1 Tax=Anaerosphaera multitolerans TaxID=2487351 RepID=A0A437S5G2_9FIRM|nr:copper amine oxidase N-terminal domain-containing protein [Anaerosphaera multitolerans]RVU54207.1 copper amine oxidase N-terminal domain-containing protein [Anaerosphaera multitolerans]
MKKNLNLIFILLFFIIPKNVQAQEEIKIWINGEYVQSEVAPFIEENITLAPIKAVAEQLNYEISWNENARKVTIQNENNYLELTIGKTIAEGRSIDNEVLSFSLEVPPKIIDNHTFVPLRFVVEQLGSDISWDGENRTVIIGEGYNLNDSN